MKNLMALLTVSALVFMTGCEEGQFNNPLNDDYELEKMLADYRSTWSSHLRCMKDDIDESTAKYCEKLNTDKRVQDSMSAIHDLDFSEDYLSAKIEQSAMLVIMEQSCGVFASSQAACPMAKNQLDTANRKLEIYSR